VAVERGAQQEHGVRTCDRVELAACGARARERRLHASERAGERLRAVVAGRQRVPLDVRLDVRLRCRDRLIHAEHVAFALALLAHRRRWLVPPIIQVTGILYTLPSVAVFFLLLPITGRGKLTAIVALTAYTLLILFRNVIAGLDNVPPEARDAGRGMGLTERQLLWRVELPLALPEIMAGLRIAVTTTVGLAALAFLAGAGGLGEAIFDQVDFRSNVLVAGGMCVLLAVVLDFAVLAVQRAITPWLRVA
jgi:osmoprotectant transport system permease protein